MEFLAHALLDVRTARMEFGGAAVVVVDMCTLNACAELVYRKRNSARISLVASSPEKRYINEIIRFYAALNSS